METSRSVVVGTRRRSTTTSVTGEREAGTDAFMNEPHSPRRGRSAAQRAHIIGSTQRISSPMRPERGAWMRHAFSGRGNARLRAFPPGQVPRFVPGAFSGLRAPLQRNVTTLKHNS